MGGTPPSSSRSNKRKLYEITDTSKSSMENKPITPKEVAVCGPEEPIDKDEARTYKENANSEEDGVVIEPFNQEQEKEEGYFDDVSNFVHYTTDKGIKDALLDSVDAESNLAQNFFAGNSYTMVKDDEDTDELSSDDVGKIKRRITNLLEPEEVLQVSKRLKGTSSGKKEKMPEVANFIFDKNTEESMKLMDNDDYVDQINFAVDETKGNTAAILRSENAVVIAVELQKESKRRTLNRFRKVGSDIICCRTSELADVAIQNYEDNEYKKMSTKKKSTLKVDQVAQSLSDLSGIERAKQGGSGAIDIFVAGIEKDTKTKAVTLGAWVSTYQRILKVKDFRCIGSHGIYGSMMLDAMYKNNLSDEDLIELGIKAVFCSSEREKFYGDLVHVYLITKEGIREVGEYSFEVLVKKYDTYEEQRLMKPVVSDYYRSGAITEQFRRCKENRERETSSAV